MRHRSIMRSLLAVLLLVSLALAGCSDAPAGPKADVTQDVDSPPDDTNTTVPDSIPPANVTAPALIEADLSASVTEGAAPMEVVFTMSIRNATATLSWGLDVDGDGDNETQGTAAEPPASYTAAYAVVGTYTASLAVRDAGATFYSNITITVTPAVPVHSVTGSTTVMGMPWTSGFVAVEGGVGAKGCVGFVAGQNERDCVWGSVAADLAGHPFTFTTGPSAKDYSFLDGCSATAEVVQAHGGDAEGIVPAGTSCVVMWNYGTGTGAFRFDFF